MTGLIALTAINAGLIALLIWGTHRLNQTIREMKRVMREDEAAQDQARHDMEQAAATLLFDARAAGTCVHVNWITEDHS